MPKEITRLKPPTRKEKVKSEKEIATTYQKNKNPFKILKNFSNIVRLKLEWKDVTSNFLLKNNLVEERTHNGSKFYVFKKPFYVPDLGHYYTFKVRYVDNEYLAELIEKIIFLNPHPNEYVKMKIAECILEKFVEHEEFTDAKNEETKYTLVLTYKEVRDVVDEVAHSKKGENHNPTIEQSILYADRKLSKGDKIIARIKLGREGDKKFYKNAIAKAINVLIENDHDVKITFADLAKTKIVKKFKSNDLASEKLIRSNTTDFNKKAIDLHNATAVFKTKSVKVKYEQFLLMDNPTLNEITSQCNVSRRDAMVFRNLSNNK